MIALYVLASLLLQQDDTAIVHFRVRIAACDKNNQCQVFYRPVDVDTQLQCDMFGGLIAIPPFMKEHPDLHITNSRCAKEGEEDI